MGQTQNSTGTGDIALTQLPSLFPIKGNLMPGFRHNLIGVVPLCNVDCTATFTREAIIVHNKQGTAMLTG